MVRLKVPRRTGMTPLTADRQTILSSIQDLRRSGAEISQLLASDGLHEDDWDRAVRILARCRQERRRLDGYLRIIDETQ